jgi:hypothetical protein
VLGVLQKVAFDAWLLMTLHARLPNAISYAYLNTTKTAGVVYRRPDDAHEGLVTPCEVCTVVEQGLKAASKAMGSRALRRLGERAMVRGIIARLRGPPPDFICHAQAIY